MLKHLTDPANAITAVGLGLAVLGIYLGLTGRPELGITAVLWAFLADHVDGVVARRARNRARETAQIGRHLDSLSDLVCECIFPALILMVSNAYSTLSLAIGIAIVVVGALRLSCYNTFGARDGYFVGLPVTYIVPAVAVLFLLSPLIPPTLFGPLLNGAFGILIVLHLSTFRVPVTKGWMYAAVTMFVIAASAVFVSRSLTGYL